MRCCHANLVVGAILVVFCSLGSMGQQNVASGEETPAQHKIIQNLRVSGPVMHQNLAVYLLHSKDRDDRRFLTLNEGLKRKLVKVTELENERVNTLVIENLSDDPLFLQEGDRVTGGKQDRTIYTSLVVAPKSGPQEIPGFCVEPSRWQEGATGKQFAGNANPGYAANSVRIASKLLKNQSLVWENVARSKDQLMKAVGTMDKTSSLNEAQDSAEVAEGTKPFLDALSNVADKHDDLVGVAFAVNGTIQEINVFPGRELAKTVYPRMLEAYALDALVQATEDNDGAKQKAPAAAQVLAMLKTPTTAEPDRDEQINADNSLQIFAATTADEQKDVRLYNCVTQHKGKSIHLQWINGPRSIEAVRQAEQQRPSGEQQLQIDNNFNDRQLQRSIDPDFNPPALNNSLQQ